MFLTPQTRAKHPLETTQPHSGWRFGGCGACADIPQLNGEPTALATACGSARTRLATFPVQVR